MHPDPAVFSQGLELIKAHSEPMETRHKLAMQLLDSPVRAISVMAANHAIHWTITSKYAMSALLALGRKEAEVTRPPHPSFFTAIKDSNTADPSTPLLKPQHQQDCMNAITRLRRAGREHNMSSVDPARYSALRLLEVLVRVQQEPQTIHSQLPPLVRQLARLEPRGLLGHEQNGRELLCTEALHASLNFDRKKKT